MKDHKIVLKVAGKSSVPSVAGSIVKSVEDNKKVEIHTIGASATSQAVKSIATARGILATKGLDVSVVPGFGTTTIEDVEKTMLTFKVIVE